MLKRSMVLTAVITLLMVVAAPALAGAPNTDPYPGANYAYAWDYGPNTELTEVCGFPVFTSGKVRQGEKIFVDREGLPNRWELHIKGDIDTYAPEFGTFLKVKWAVHISERRIKGTDDWSQTWTGTGWNYHAPGSGNGALLHDRGRVTLLWQDFWWTQNPPLSWSGPRDHHDVLVNRVDWVQAKCDALAP